MQIINKQKLLEFMKRGQGHPERQDVRAIESGMFDIPTILMKKWCCNHGCGEAFLTSELVNKPVWCPNCGTKSTVEYEGLQTVTMERMNVILGNVSIKPLDQQMHERRNLNLEYRAGKWPYICLSCEFDFDEFSLQCPNCETGVLVKKSP